MKFVKWLIGLLLLPFCVSVLIAVARMFLDLDLGSSHRLPRSAWGFGIGFVLWTVLYFSLSRPTRSYVLAHELTHALWAVLCGSRVSEIRVGRDSGHVKMDRTNFLIILAPYIFPFYTVLVLLLYGVLGLFYDLSHYEPFWMGLLGLTWAFHLTFTFSTLKTSQPDIHENGRLFSYTFIFSLNLLGLGVWMALVADQPGFPGLARALSGALRFVYGHLWAWLLEALAAIPRG